MSPEKAKAPIKESVKIVSASNRLSGMMPTSGPIKVKATAVQDHQSENAAAPQVNTHEAAANLSQGDDKQLSDWDDDEEDAYANSNSFKK